jgi:hypothetical protein
VEEDLESRIKALEEKNKELEEKITPNYPKVSSIQASGDLKEKLDTFREDGKKESFEDIIWKLTSEVETSRIENHAMRELRELLIPIPRHIIESTPEEIDSLDLSGLMPEIEKSLKTFWKRVAFAKKEEGNNDNIPNNKSKWN